MNDWNTKIFIQVCKFLEMREYKWESIKNISGAKGKFKRALLQFTPESWTHVRWLDPNSSYMRLVAIIQLMLIWQACIMYYYLCWGDLMVETLCTTQWINFKSKGRLQKKTVKLVTLSKKGEWSGKWLNMECRVKNDIFLGGGRGQEKSWIWNVREKMTFS